MFPSDPPENLKKPLLFRCFQGDQREALGRKRLRIKTALYALVKFLHKLGHIHHFLNFRWI